MRRTNPALQSTVNKTAYGRRVVTDNVARKTFAILGASTPEIRISTMGASRKMKIMDRVPNYKRRRTSVSEMHNASLRQWCLIARPTSRYLSGNANDRGDLICQRVDNMTERARSWDN